MIEPSWIIGFDQKGVFWTNTIKVFLVKMRYELKDFIAPNGSIVIPMSDKSWNLVEYYKEYLNCICPEYSFLVKAYYPGWFYHFTLDLLISRKTFSLSLSISADV